MLTCSSIHTLFNRDNIYTFGCKQNILYYTGTNFVETFFNLITHLITGNTCFTQFLLYSTDYYKHVPFVVHVLPYKYRH